jgi:hypothetical protein
LALRPARAGYVYFLRLVVSSPVIRAFVLGLIEGPAAIPLTGPVDRISLARAREAYAPAKPLGTIGNGRAEK